jgi:hypothetical protein
LVDVLAVALMVAGAATASVALLGAYRLLRAR